MDNNLIRILRTFTISEIRSFGDYIGMPAVNSRKAVSDLYRILSGYYPEFNSNDISKQNLFAGLFPGKKFKDSAIRPLLHYLTELALDFISIQHFCNSVPQFDIHRVGALLERKIFGNIPKAMERAKENLVNGNLNAETYHFHNYLLKHIKLDFLEKSKAGIYEKFLPEINVQDVFEELTNFYDLLTFRMYVNVLNINNVFGTKLPTEQFEKRLEYVEKFNITGDPVTEIYYYLAKLITDPDSNHYYRKVRNLMRSGDFTIHTQDLQEIYINLENYCNRKILEGETEFMKEKFGICKEEIETGIYKRNGTMSPVFFKGIVSLALKLSEYEWVREFMSGHREEIEKEPLINSYNFCMASYEFAMKNYWTSLEYLAAAGYDDIYMKLDSRILQLLNYYETDSLETLWHSLESFRHFLSSGLKIPVARMSNYKNFYRYFRKLAVLKQKKDAAEIELLNAQVAKEQKIAQKSWLISKIAGLKYNIR